MLTLRNSPASPFGRKVVIAADLLGLAGRIDVVLAETANPHDSLRVQNPLGKIPTLLLESGEALYDSRVILEYLDHLAGGDRIIPAAGMPRFTVLRQQALADGLIEATLLQVYEKRFRSEERHEPKWLEYQQGKVERALAAAQEIADAPLEAIHVGQITLACALGYLDLRMEGRWRASHPALVAWLSAFEAQVPAFARTRVTA
jgi:glutathione S-transferase